MLLSFFLFNFFPGIVFLLYLFRSSLMAMIKLYSLMDFTFLSILVHKITSLIHTIIYFFVVDIKPTSVEVRRIGGDQAEIFWVESENMSLFDQNMCCISIASRKFQTDTNWSVIKTMQGIHQCSHVIPYREVEEYEYAVQYRIIGRSSDWVKAERVHCSKRQCRYTVKTRMLL